MIGTTTKAFFAAVMLSALIASRSTAVEIAFDSMGFEDPPYSLGDLEGQNDWFATDGTIGSAVVQDTTVFSGSQAVRIDRAAGGNDRWAPAAILFPGLPDERFVCIEWDMLVEGPASADDFGPFFGVEAFDANVNPDAPDRLGMLGVDASTGDVLFSDGGVLTETGSDVSFGEWNNFQLEFDFGTATYAMWLNGSLLGSTGFETVTDFVTDIDLSAIAASVTGGDLTGTAYFDNFAFSNSGTSKIPEPGSWMLVVCSSAALLAVRRRRLAVA